MHQIHASFFGVIFFFNDTATTEIYTLSLHDALPIYRRRRGDGTAVEADRPQPLARAGLHALEPAGHRSEEHTSELQSRRDLVCRLLLEKKNEHRPLGLVRRALDSSARDRPNIS